MKPLHTHTETVDGLININGQESDCSISIEGETFEDNIFPMAANGVHSRFTVKNLNTGALIALWTFEFADSAETNAYDTFFTTNQYVYNFHYNTGTVKTQEVVYFYAGNNTSIPVDYITTVFYRANRAYVGSRSTIGVWATIETYETFNSIEAGTGESLPQTPSEITYTIANVDSLYGSYYNNSKFDINYQVEYTISDELHEKTKKWINYRIDLINNTQGTQLGSFSFNTVCDSSGFFTVTWTCEAKSNVLFTPSTYWGSGNYIVKLYEVNISSGANAFLSSDAFTVLNQSGTPITATKSTDIHTGDNQESLNQLDGILIYTGLGVSDISRFFMALFLTILAVVIGNKWKDGSGYIIGIGSYSFFTYIDWIPEWIIIVVILALASKWFR